MRRLPLSHNSLPLDQTKLLLMTLLRLSPVMPFTFSNYLTGLSSISPVVIFLGTLLGTLPTQLVYVTAGTMGCRMHLDPPSSPPLRSASIPLRFTTVPSLPLLSPHNPLPSPPLRSPCLVSPRLPPCLPLPPLASPPLLSLPLPSSPFPTPPSHPSPPLSPLPRCLFVD